MTELQPQFRWLPGSLKTRRDSNILLNAIKSTRGRGSVTLPSLGPSLTELQQLATDCGVDFAAIWQTALALTLHSYNPSEPVSFACQNEMSGLERHKNVYIYTLRIEPTETVLGLLRRFDGCRNPGTGGLVDHRISSTRLGAAGPDAVFCKVAMRCHTRAGKRSFSDMDQTLDSLFNIVPKHASRLAACLEYSALDISEGLAWSMLYSIDTVLKNMSMSLQLHVEDIEFCSQFDLEMVQRFTSSVATIEQRCIHELILDQCRATPDAIAITSSWAEDFDITYAQLDRLTSQLAHHLVDIGVRPEVFVLICLEKSMWAIVARVAVLRAGGAYIMIDARNPPTYLNSIVQRAKANIMLTSSQYTNSPIFRNLLPTIVEISRDFIQSLPNISTPPTTNVKSHNACLILFTSGSTGAPKGIIQTHQSYATAIREYAKALKLSPATRMLQFDDYAFDISNNDFLAPLMTGGVCCVPRAFNAENPPTIPKLVQEINVLQATATFLTPTVAVQINPDDVKSLNLICIGGEPMAKELLDKWYGRGKLINQYGMGEVATFCAYNDHPTTDKPATIGHPACNTIWLVSLASTGRLVPVGAVGEVLIEGPNIARGYLDDQPRISGARFLDSVPSWMARLHPERQFSSMYLSGDLARYNHDGTLEYIGRKDLLLKLDGCRVDAVEVEHCVRKIIHANDSVVIDLLGNITETAQPMLTAYLYLHDHPMASLKAGDDTVFRRSTSCALASVKVREIQAALKDTLPYHMIPTNFLLINQIPRTKSKKVDRKKLHAQGDIFWKMHLSCDRRILLITQSRSASDLLISAFSLKEQSAVIANSNAGYFIPPCENDEWVNAIQKKHYQEWTENERSKIKEMYQKYFMDFEHYTNSATAIGKTLFVTEYSESLTDPVALSHFLDQYPDQNIPPVLRIPEKYLADTDRSSLNQTFLPDNFLTAWTPVFLIKHPLADFPSKYRTIRDKKNVINGTEDHSLRVHLTLHWARRLYEFYAEHFRLTASNMDEIVKFPIVVDIDDVGANPRVACKLCKLLGLDTTKLASNSQESVIGDESAINAGPEHRESNESQSSYIAEGVSFSSTVTISEITTNGLKPSAESSQAYPSIKNTTSNNVIMSKETLNNHTTTNKRAADKPQLETEIHSTINIDSEAVKWRREFGEAGAVELEKLVRAAMPDYNYLKKKILQT